MRAQPINRFGRQRDEAPGVKDGGGAVQCFESRGGMQVLWVDGQPQRFHSVYCLPSAGLAASGDGVLLQLREAQEKAD